MVSETTFVKGITRLPTEIQEALAIKDGYKIKWSVLTEGHTAIITVRPPSIEELKAIRTLKQK